MSVKKELYKAMGTYLMGALQVTGPDFPNGIIPPELDLPGLKWFDKQMGQFIDPQLAVAIPLPCILMQYQPFQWNTVGKQQQRGTGMLRFTLYFENYADAFTGSVNSELALRFFEFTEQMHTALQGLILPGIITTALDRVSDNEDASEDMIITSTVDYMTTMVDAATDISRNYTMADPEVTVEKVDATTRPAPDTFIDGFIIS